MARTPTSTDEPDAGFTGWLAARPDDALVDLLSERPDVAVPSPTSVEVLSSRLRLPASVRRALDGLALGPLTVLTTASALGADTGAVTHADIADRFPASDADAVTNALAHLRSLALLWGPEDSARISPSVATAVGESPVVVPTPDEPVGAQLTDALDGLPERARAMLTAIAAGPVPVGSLSPDAPAAAHSAVESLVDAGLARRAPDGSVHPTAHALRRLRAGDNAQPGDEPDSLLAPPRWPGRETTQRATDEASGVSALDLLHQCEVVLDALSGSPGASLKSGGLGVRELRRLSRLTAIETDELGLLLEVLHGARLIGIGDCEVGADHFEDVWAPTDAADVWRRKSRAARWADLVHAWLHLPVRPWLGGTEAVGGGTIPVLNQELRGRSTFLERRRLLRALADVPADTAADPASLTEIVRWRYPRWVAHGSGEVVRHTLHEARRLGLVVGVQASSAARDIAVGREDPGGTSGDRTDLTTLLAGALPEEVSEVIVQADLTILAPGPLEADLADECALLADVESAGTATTYRVTERSVRRALDAGRTAAELTEFLGRISATPLPQSLTYLVDDVARRHGQLRVGSAMAFCRSEDTALLAEVTVSEAADRCALRAIAPTVLIAQSPPMDVVDALRESGFAPVVEDTAGGIVSVRRRTARVAATPTRTTMRQAVERLPDASDLRKAVATMRSSDRIRAARSGADGSVRTGEAAVAFLHEAAREGRPVAVSVVDDAGRSDTRLVVPASVGAGRIEGVEPETAQAVRLALHRVISVTDVDAQR